MTSTRARCAFQAAGLEEKTSIALAGKSFSETAVSSGRRQREGVVEQPDGRIEVLFRPIGRDSLRWLPPDSLARPSHRAVGVVETGALSPRNYTEKTYSHSDEAGVEVDMQ